MSEKEFIEDDTERMLYHRIPSGVAFEGMGLLGAFFTQWIKKRKARKQEKSKVEQKIATIEKKVEIIEV